MELFIQITVGLFAVAGVISIGRKILRWLMCGIRGGVRDVTVIVRMEKAGGEQSFECALRSLLFCTDGIVTGKGAPEIYVVDTGFDEEARSICGLLASESGRLSLVKEWELRNIT